MGAPSSSGEPLSRVLGKGQGRHFRPSERSKGDEWSEFQKVTAKNRYSSVRDEVGEVAWSVTEMSGELC